MYIRVGSKLQAGTVNGENTQATQGRILANETVDPVEQGEEILRLQFGPLLNESGVRGGEVHVEGIQQFTVCRTAAEGEDEGDELIKKGGESDKILVGIFGEDAFAFIQRADRFAEGFSFGFGFHAAASLQFRWGWGIPLTTRASLLAAVH